jgi:ACS family tartrate transporter-like MFS transporter
VDKGLESTVLSKVTRRILPFLLLLYVFNYLDRTNVSVVALQMKPDLGITDTAYGIGAGIFFLGYFFFEVPSNLVLERIGARIWMARIMVTWGMISSATLFVRSANGFCVMRFLLGVAEAGFFPGMILYLSYWFPTAQRARCMSRFMMATALASIFGQPLSGWLLQHLNGAAGMKGWQWVFLIEGIPSVLLGIVTFFYLTDRPEKAGWLRPEERDWLVQRLAHERAHRDRHFHFTLRQAFLHPTVLLLAALYFSMVICGYGLGFWTPLLLKSRSGGLWSDQTISFASTIPSIAAILAMGLGGVHSDRHGERRWHVAVGTWIGVAGVVAGAFVGSPWLTIAALSVAGAGPASALGPFWAMSTSMMGSAGAAGGIALVNSIGNLGGFAGPSVMGWLKENTHSFTAGLCVLACGLATAGVLALLSRHDPKLERGVDGVQGLNTTEIVAAQD